MNDISARNCSESDLIGLSQALAHVPDTDTKNIREGKRSLSTLMITTTHRAQPLLDIEKLLTEVRGMQQSSTSTQTRVDPYPARFIHKSLEIRQTPSMGRGLYVRKLTQNPLHASKSLSDCPARFETKWLLASASCKNSRLRGYRPLLMDHIDVIIVWRIPAYRLHAPSVPTCTAVRLVASPPNRCVLFHFVYTATPLTVMLCLVSFRNITG
jgi:hypothetical protein